MTTLETIRSLVGALFGWYTNNAALVFAACIVAAIIGEKLLHYLRGKELHLRSAATSILSGAGFLVAKTIFEKLLFVALGFYIYDNFRLFTLDLGSPWVWLGVLLVRDFVYYWVHRAEHGVRVLWASHLIHHSPSDIGMSTAIRIPWMEAVYKPWFSLWMPLLGFHPLAKIVLDVFVSTLQQAHHTEAFARRRDGKLPLIGHIFVIPSTHRVHHGYNPEYIDKNFGAVFIFWDRIFGTFEPEGVPVVFGIGEVDAVDTPSDVLVGGYRRLWRNMRSTGSPLKAVAVAIRHP
jgi:sterol desaturase/sphingolipid hydroxylase (fatty acid hydroxylase superfamily)